MPLETVKEVSTQHSPSVQLSIPNLFLKKNHMNQFIPSWEGSDVDCALA